MSAMDGISQERQRIADRLARLDAERAKLDEQLRELEVAERVLSRYSGAPSGRGRAAASASAAEEPAPKPRRGRPAGRKATAAPAAEEAPRTRGRRKATQPAETAASAPERPAEASTPAKRGGRRRQQGGTPSLSDAALTSVQRRSEGISVEELRKYLGREFGLEVKPNSLGVTLQRHRRAGRIESRDSRWYPTSGGGKSGDQADAEANG